MTRRVASLHWRAPEAEVELHPADAARYAVHDGARVRVRSRRGALVARARITDRIVPGTVFLPFHFAEAAANALTYPALDPRAKIPEFKVCAAAIEALPGGRCWRVVGAPSLPRPPVAPEPPEATAPGRGTPSPSATPRAQHLA